MRTFIHFILIVMISLGSMSAAAQAVDSTFTYQGELRQLGSPANAVFDFQFRLYDDPNGGVQIGPTINQTSVGVVNGQFSAPLDFGAGQFLGDAQWLEVSVRAAGSSSFEILIPRTAITATPYAIGAFTALADSVSGLSVIDGSIGTADVDPAQIQRRVSGACAGGQAIASISENGQVLCASGSGGTISEILPGAGLAGGGDAGSVILGIAPGGVGSAEIDPSAVQARVSGACPAGQFLRSVNVDGSVVCDVDQSASPGWGLGGNAGTNPATDFIGTTDTQPLVLRSNNQVIAELQSVALTAFTGGHTANVKFGSPANQLVGDVRGATIGGGGAPAGDVGPDFTGPVPNRVAGHYGTVGGGLANVAGDEAATPDDAWHATVAGGFGNSATGTHSTVGGGDQNFASGSASVAAGGSANVADGLLATVSGGQANFATGGGSVVGGGGQNFAAGPDSTVSGGYLNSASNFGSAVAGGAQNTASGFYSSVGGGFSNRAVGPDSTVAGGSSNAAAGNGSTVSGGTGNCAGGSDSWAGGRRAKVRPANDPGSGACSNLFSYPGGDGDQGTFVWADAQEFDFPSTGNNQFLVRAAGGVAINTNNPQGNALRVAGAIRMDTLASGGATTLCRNGNFQIGFCSSSARYKDDIADLDLGLETIQRLRPVAYRWKQSGDADVGFVAEAVAELDPRLATYDEQGTVEGVKYERISAVLTNAVQELARREQRHAENLARSNMRYTELVVRLDAENDALREELAALRTLILNPAASGLTYE